MKTLATFFVTLLLLAGSAWAQTQTGLDQLTGTPVETVTIAAKAQAGNGDIWDELIVNVLDGQYGYQLNINKLQKPANVSPIEAYTALGREAVRLGMSKGYTPVGSTAKVWTSDHSYVMTFSTGNGVTLISLQGGGSIN